MNARVKTVPNRTAVKEKEIKKTIFEDEFLNLENLLTFKRDAAQRRLKQVLMEMNELIREKKWEDAVALFHPVEEKIPELLTYHLEIPVREKIGFVLQAWGQTLILDFN